MHLRTLLVALVGSIALAAGPRLAAQDEPAPRFVIDTRDGPLPAAAVRKLTAAWTLERSGSNDALAVGDWVGMQQHGRARPAPHAGPVVILGSGDRLPIKTGRPVR